MADYKKCAIFLALQTVHKKCIKCLWVFFCINLDSFITFLDFFEKKIIYAIPWIFWQFQHFGKFWPPGGIPVGKEVCRVFQI